MRSSQQTDTHYKNTLFIIRDHFQEAEKYLNEENYDEALPLFLIAGNKCIEINAFEEMAVCYQEAGDCCTKLARLALANKNPTLASMYYSDAIEHYQIILNHFSETADSEELGHDTMVMQNESLSIAAEKLVEVYFQQKNYHDALSIAQIAVKSTLKACPDEKPVIANSLRALAICYHHLNDTDNAYLNYEAALKLYEELFDAIRVKEIKDAMIELKYVPFLSLYESNHFAEANKNIEDSLDQANNHFCDSQYVSAIPFYRQALKHSSLAGSSYKNKFFCFKQLSICYSKLAKTTTIGESKTDSSASQLSNLEPKSLNKLQATQVAKFYLKNAINLYSSKITSENMQYVTPKEQNEGLLYCYDKLIKFYLEEGKVTKIIKCCKIKAELLQKLDPTDFFVIGKCYEDIAELYIEKLKDYKNARRYLNSTCDYYITNKSTANCERLINQFHNLAQLYINEKNYQDAIACAIKIIQLANEIPYLPAQDIAIHYESLAKLYIVTHDDANAVKYLGLALSYYQKALSTASGALFTSNKAPVTSDIERINIQIDKLNQTVQSSSIPASNKGTDSNNTTDLEENQNNDTAQNEATDNTPSSHTLEKVILVPSTHKLSPIEVVYPHESNVYRNTPNPQRSALFAFTLLQTPSFGNRKTESETVKEEQQARLAPHVQ